LPTKLSPVGFPESSGIPDSVKILKNAIPLTVGRGKFVGFLLPFFVFVLQSSDEKHVERLVLQKLVGHREPVPDDKLPFLAIPDDPPKRSLRTPSWVGILRCGIAREDALVLQDQVSCQPEADIGLEEERVGLIDDVQHHLTRCPGLQKRAVLHEVGDNGKGPPELERGHHPKMVSAMIQVDGNVLVVAQSMDEELVADNASLTNRIAQMVAYDSLMISIVDKDSMAAVDIQGEGAGSPAGNHEPGFAWRAVLVAAVRARWAEDRERCPRDRG